MKKGYIYSLTSAMLFGLAGVFVKLTQITGLESIQILTVQYTIAVILMFGLLFITNKNKLKISKKELINLIVLGVLGNSFMTMFYYKAFEYLSVSMVTMLIYTYPIIVFIYTSIFDSRKIGIKKILALVIAFIGSLLTLNILNGNFNYSFIGITYGVLGAIFYAFMNIYIEKKLENTDSLALNAYSTLFSLIALYIYKFPLFIFKGDVSIESIGYISILAIFCEIVPLTLLYAAIKSIGALKVSIINNLEIPVAMIVSFLVLGEKINLGQIIGTALVMYAIYLITDKQNI